MRLPLGIITGRKSTASRPNRGAFRPATARLRVESLEERVTLDADGLELLMSSWSEVQTSSANSALAAVDYGVYRWGRLTPGSELTWINEGGGGVGITAGPDGESVAPWIVNSAGNIFRKVGGQWQLMPGGARDIDVNKFGVAYIIGMNPVGAGGDYGIYSWNGATWVNEGGGGVRIAVGPDGSPWMVNSIQDIYHKVGGNWQQLPGKAYDIDVAPGDNGTPWIIGTNPTGSGNFGIYSWNGSTWVNMGGGGVRIAASTSQTAYVVNANQDIYGPGANGPWTQLPGKAFDIGTGFRDSSVLTPISVYVIGTNQINQPPIASAGGPYSINEGEPLSLSAMASDPNGDALTYSWDVNNDGLFGDAVGQSPTVSAAQLAALGIGDGSANIRNIYVRVSDGQGGVTTSTNGMLSVVNTPPTAGIAGPASVQRDLAHIYVLSASDPSSADQAAGFTYTIDWNGDGSDVEVVNGLSGTVVAHTFNTVGARTIKVTATDKDGGVSTQATHSVTVSAVQLVNNAGAIDLVWTGTAGADHVEFEQLGPDSIRVTTTLENGLATNFVETFSGVTGRIDAKGNEGVDTLDASQLDDIAATLDGGTGNNTLYGGGANDTLIGGANFGAQVNGPEGQQGSNVIVGGAGDDTIYGNAVNGAEGKGGNNLLLGGAGNDTLYGNWTDGGEGGGRNILVGGLDDDTLYDYKVADGAEGKGSILIAGDTTLGVADLSLVMSEWSSSSSYTARVDNILGLGGGGSNGSAYLQSPGTVSSDSATNELSGTTAGGLNWFWYVLATDTVNRAKAGETHSAL
jgi:hypothetical protein